jgi:hypothetical protein
MANKKQHLSYNHSKQHKIHHNPYPIYGFLSILLMLVVGAGIYSYNIIQENNKPLDNEYVSSELAKSDFLKIAAPEAVQKNADKAAPPTATAGKTTTKPKTIAKAKSAPTPAKSSQTAITGNANTSVAPTLPATVATPKSPVDSVKLFVSSVKSGDLKTANSLIGPTMAYDIATVAGSSDQTLALEACRANYLCAALIDSFNPPTTAKVVLTEPGGIAQVSFKLSQSSPLLATLLGDQNIDIFLMNYSGVWVIQNVYINGQPLVMAGI